MRTINLLALLATLVISTTLQASLAPNLELVRATRLEKLKLDKNVYFAKNSTGKALIEINETQELIRLIVPQKINCPEGAACNFVRSAPVIIELPITASYSGFFGGFTYEGELDETTVDGLHQKIVVRDNSYSACFGTGNQPLTEVIYTDYNPWTDVSTKSLMFGGALLENGKEYDRPSKLDK